MKKRNKILALLLAMTMCSSVLAGCANGDVQSSNELSSSESAETSQSEVGSSESVVEPSSSESNEPLANVDIYPLESDKTFKVISSSKNMENAPTIITQAMEDATGVKIDWNYMTYEQIQLTLSGKEFPDAIFLFGGALDKTTAYDYGKAGYLVNFMDYLDIMPNFSAVIEEHPEYLEVAQNEDGSVYLLPRINVTATVFNNLLYYRTDMMQEIGWENPPATTEEFVKYIKELQAHFSAKDPEFIAFNVYAASHLTWNSNRAMSFFFPAFGELLETGLTVDSNDKVVLGAATEQYKHLLEFMNELWNSGAFNQNVYTQDAAASQALNAGSHTAITSQTTGFTTAAFASGNMDLNVLAPLTSEYWDTPQWYEAPAATISNTCAISAKCEDIETMVKWFDAWYSTQENPLTEDGSVFGITPWLGRIGIDYVMDDENMLYVEQAHEGIESGKFASTQGFANAPYSGYADGYFPYTMDLNNATGVKGRGTIDNLWPYAKQTVALTSLVLTQDENDTYADKWTDINAYIVDTTAKFITGDLSIADNWDSYVARLEQMGLKELIEVFESAYSRSK